MSALLEFLDVYPYREKRTFDTDISHPWKTGSVDEAVKRLKRLAGCILLRRPKATVQLPPKRDMACHVDFHSSEQQLYQEVRSQTIARLDEALHENQRSSGAISFVSVLQQNEAMRMVCNLGLLYPTRHDASLGKGKMPEIDIWPGNAQRGFDLRLQMGNVECHFCSHTLDANVDPLGGMESKKLLFTQCLKVLCQECTQKLSRRSNAVDCGHNSPCPTAPVSMSASSLEESPVMVSPATIIGSGYLPTKVKALIEDLNGLPGDVKWYVFLRAAVSSL